MLTLSIITDCDKRQYNTLHVTMFQFVGIKNYSMASFLVPSLCNFTLVLNSIDTKSESRVVATYQSTLSVVKKG